jgi:hypothetical protein
MNVLWCLAIKTRLERLESAAVAVTDDEHIAARGSDVLVDGFSSSAHR